MSYVLKINGNDFFNQCVFDSVKLFPGICYENSMFNWVN